MWAKAQARRCRTQANTGPDELCGVLVRQSQDSALLLRHQHTTGFVLLPHHRLVLVLKQAEQQHVLEQRRAFWLMERLYMPTSLFLVS